MPWLIWLAASVPSLVRCAYTSAPPENRIPATWSRVKSRSVTSASAAACAIVIWSSLNMDGDPSITITTSSGVARLVHGVPTEDVQVNFSGDDCTGGPLIVAVAVTVSVPRFGPSYVNDAVPSALVTAEMVWALPPAIANCTPRFAAGLPNWSSTVAVTVMGVPSVCVDGAPPSDNDTYPSGWPAARLVMNELVNGP